MTPHELLYEELMKHPKVSDDDKRLTPAQFLRYLFRNYRGKYPESSGLRLSYGGMLILKQVFDHYEIKHDGDIPTKYLLKFNKEVKYPYFLGNKTWIVFNGDLATMLMLNEGSIKKVVDMGIF